VTLSCHCDYCTCGDTLLATERCRGGLLSDRTNENLHGVCENLFVASCEVDSAKCQDFQVVY
jgi:hypothetical protein